MTEERPASAIPIDYSTPGRASRMQPSFLMCVVALLAGFGLILISGGMLLVLVIAIANEVRITDVVGGAMLIFSAILLIAGLGFLIIGFVWLAHARRRADAT